MEKENELKTIHDNWLNHPMTKAAFRAIEEHKKAFIEANERDATNPTVPSDLLRMGIVAQKTCNAITAKLQNKSNFNLTPNELNNL